MTSAADQTVTRPQLWKGVRFDNAEYVERLARFQANLARQDVGVAVVADERTTWYLTGFGDVTPIGSRARPRIVVVPAEGDPTFFVHESTATTVREMTWFDDVRTYEPLGQAPVNEIAARVREAAALRVGLELGGQLRPELTLTEIWRLG